MNNVRDNIFPLIWLDEGGDLDQANADIFDDMYTKPVTIAAVLTYGVCFGIGILSVVLSYIYIWIR